MALVLLAFTLLVPSILATDLETDETKIDLSVDSKSSESTADTYKYYSTEASEAAASVRASSEGGAVLAAVEGEVKALDDVIAALQTLTEAEGNANCVQDEMREELNEIRKKSQEAGSECALEAKRRVDERIKGIQEIDRSIEANDELCFSLRVERSEKCDSAKETLIKKLRGLAVDDSVEQLRTCFFSGTLEVLTKLIEMQGKVEDCKSRSGDRLSYY